MTSKCSTSSFNWKKWLLQRTLSLSDIGTEILEDVPGGASTVKATIFTCALWFKAQKRPWRLHTWQTLFYTKTLPQAEEYSERNKTSVESAES